MKKLYVLGLLVLSAGYVAAQSTTDADEAARKKIAVDYLEVMLFDYESVQGESVAHIIIKAFKESLEVIDTSKLNVINTNDQVKISALVFALNNLKNNPAPSWEELVEAEKNFLIMQDKALRRESKYKTE